MGHDNADINGGPGSAAETEYDPNQVNARLNRMESTRNKRDRNSNH